MAASYTFGTVSSDSSVTGSLADSKSKLSIPVSLIRDSIFLIFLIDPLILKIPCSGSFSKTKLQHLWTNRGTVSLSPSISSSILDVLASFSNKWPEDKGVATGVAVFLLKVVAEAS
ncbi:hypothetical protein OGAPHI_000086 [Ogataea philodendri]|uniref:Uncharacterized protein n=1 Tax=Ogataea philodendri TaxID=1378263 RepID=A0A9P8TB09_9ASCO|nr:uncharacterized protein OGAPHI_000086 [Ogataea philodendri]KAH3671900.1 hypothetical protein OGAPHI_000086 [Ogataea philodendri]